MESGAREYNLELNRTWGLIAVESSGRLSDVQFEVPREEWGLSEVFLGTFLLVVRARCFGDSFLLCKIKGWGA